MEAKCRTQVKRIIVEKQVGSKGMVRKTRINVAVRIGVRL